jgi:hypothetical protein
VAQDFEAFYAQRSLDATGVGTKQVLVLTSDAKGIAVRPEDLREATRRAAKQQQHKLQKRLTRGEKRNRKRMDRTGARWSLAGAEAVLRLRALCTNGDFDEYWRLHLAQEHERNHRSRYANATVPNPLPCTRSAAETPRDQVVWGPAAKEPPPIQVGGGSRPDCRIGVPNRKEPPSREIVERRIGGEHNRTSCCWSRYCCCRACTRCSCAACGVELRSPRPAVSSQPIAPRRVR